jgi:hypothetical protein
MPLNQNCHTKYCKKKPPLNILISRGDIMGDTGLIDILYSAVNCVVTKKKRITIKCAYRKY